MLDSIRLHLDDESSGHGAVKRGPETIMHFLFGFPRTLECTSREPGLDLREKKTFAQGTRHQFSEQLREENQFKAPSTRKVKVLVWTRMILPVALLRRDELSRAQLSREVGTSRE